LAVHHVRVRRSPERVVAGRADDDGFGRAEGDACESESGDRCHHERCSASGRKAGSRADAFYTAVGATARGHRLRAAMSMRKQKSLVLILARELATNLATPIYIADADGELVYFNEPAEQIAAGRFAERGETSISEWVGMLAPETLEGKQLVREEMPGGIAFAERRPAHGTMRVTGL